MRDRKTRIGMVERAKARGERRTCKFRSAFAAPGETWYSIAVQECKEQSQEANAPPAVISALALVILTGGLVFFRLGHPVLLEPDEPRYVSAARNMLRGGDWLIPRFNGEPRLVKAPLFYWTIALSQAAFGDVEWAARLPSALSAIGMVLLTWRLGGSIFGSRAGFLAGVVLGSSLMVVALARLAIPDMLQGFLLTAALALFWRAARGTGGAGCAVAFLLTLGAAAWVKNGFVGLVVLASCAVYSVWTKDAGPWRSMLSPWGVFSIAAFVAMSVSWPLYAVWHEAGAGEVWKSETVLRFTKGGSHPEPLWYYLGVLPGVFLPWTIYTPLTIVWRKASRRRANRGAILLISLLGTGFVLLSACRGKLPSYVLPLMVPLSILTGWGIEGAVWHEASGGRSRGAGGRWFTGALATHLALSVAVLVVGLIRWQWLLQASRAALVMLIPPAVVLQTAAVVLGAMARRRAALAAVVAALVAMYGAGLTASVAQLAQTRSSAALVPQIAANLTPQTRLMSYKYLPTALVYYLDRSVEKYNDANELRLAMASADSFVLVLPVEHLETVQQDTGLALKVIAKAGTGRKERVVALPAETGQLRPGGP